jgi:hypothetical protein
MVMGALKIEAVAAQGTIEASRIVSLAQFLPMLPQQLMRKNQEVTVIPSLILQRLTRRAIVGRIVRILFPESQSE